MSVRILLVDDEPEIVEGLSIILTSRDPAYQVVGTAGDGLEGFDRAVELQPDIVITDIRMPRASGLDMIRDIQGYETDTEFILISGFADFEYAKRAMEYGVKFFLTKPIDDEELFACVEKIRARRERTQRFMDLADLLPEERLGALEEALDQRDEDALRTTVAEIFAIFSAHGEDLTPDNLRLLCMNLVLYGTRKYPYAKLRINNYLGKRVLSVQSLSRLKATGQLENWTFNLLKGAGEILRGDDPSGKHDIIGDAKAYIRERFAGDISLNELAERFYVSPIYFSQLFKKKTGVTYQKYLTNLRMKEACRFLRESDMRVYEVCERVGYTDVNYFSKLFERSVGLKPSAYRQDHMDRGESEAEE